MVSLVVTALFALLAHRSFSIAVDGASQLRRARIALDRAENGQRWLSAAFLSMDVGQDSATSFEGRSSSARFSTWLVTPAGWCERRELSVELAGTTFAGLVSDGRTIAFADSVSAVAFDYLLEPGADARWVPEWVSPVSAPTAVRVRVQIHGRVDTTLYLVKGRG